MLVGASGCCVCNLERQAARRRPVARVHCLNATPLACSSPHLHNTIPLVLEAGTRQVVTVPLRKGGKELGAVQLCIRHQAMPEKEAAAGGLK